MDVGEGRLTYDADDITVANSTFYLNLVKDLSWLNSKNYEHTTRDGHVLGYLIDLVVLDTQDNEYALYGAPNTWKLRNAFRKFHFKRKEMFRDSGITGDELGRYGQTIRPYLEPGMYTATVDAGNPVVYDENNVLSPIGATDTEREWTYSSLATNPGWLEYDSIADISGGTTMGLSDEWKLTILGDNVVQESTSAGRVESYITAGMIHSYNIDRMEVVTPDADETISGPNNPLAALSFQGPAVGEVVDIAEDQELEEPPYDLRDAGDSTNGIIFDYTSTDGNTLRINYIRNVFVPAGILGIVSTSVPSGEAIITAHVKAIVECRDWV